MASIVPIQDSSYPPQGGTLSSTNPVLHRPGQLLLPAYATKLLKTIKIPYGSDRTMNGVDIDPTIPLLHHIFDCFGMFLSFL